MVSREWGAWETDTPGHRGLRAAGSHCESGENSEVEGRGDNRV